MLKNDLQKLGFTSKEAEIYLSILESNNASLVDIAKKTSIPKSTVDSILPKLIKKGVIKTYLKKSRKRYAAVDPKVLQKSSKEQLETATALMPQLNALFGESSERPVVEFYEGASGLKSVLDMILDEAKEMKGIASPDKLFGALPDYFPTFTEKRIQKKISLQIIFSDSKLARERTSTDKESLRTSKIISKDSGFESLIFMWNEKVAIITFEKDISVLIVKNNSVAQTFEKMFQSMWDFHPEVTD